MSKEYNSDHYRSNNTSLFHPYNSIIAEIMDLEICQDDENPMGFWSTISNYAKEKINSTL